MSAYTFTDSSTADPSTVDALLPGIQHFYSAQMQKLDAGRSEAWASTFTVDGAFAAPTSPEPVRGRADLAAAAGAAAAEHEAQGLTRRHWLGMITIDPRPDGRVHARSYALVVLTPRGGLPTVHRSTVCEDVLVQEDGRWLVEYRQVTRDDLEAGPGPAGPFGPAGG